MVFFCIQAFCVVMAVATSATELSYNRYGNSGHHQPEEGYSADKVDYRVPSHNKDYSVPRYKVQP